MELKYKVESHGDIHISYIQSMGDTEVKYKYLKIILEHSSLVNVLSYLPLLRTVII